MKKQQVLLHKGEATQISNEHWVLNDAMCLKITCSRGTKSPICGKNYYWQALFIWSIQWDKWLNPILWPSMKSHVTMQLSCAKNHEACNPYANNSFLSRESLGMVMHHVLHNVCHSRSQRCSLGTSTVLLGIICSRLINVAAAESHGTRGREARPDNGGVSIMSASQDTTTATATQTRGMHEQGKSG